MKSVQDQLKAALGGLDKAVANLDRVTQNAQDQINENTAQITRLADRNEGLSEVKDRAGRIARLG